MVRTDDAAALDEVLDVLANERRRHALYYLRESGDATLETVAMAVVGWGSADATDGSAGPEEYRQLLISLHHHHAPLLDEAGLVDYDRAAGTLAYEGSSLADAVLDLAFARERAPDASGEENRPHREV